ncbi:hypothetical protein CYMTET_33571 [Cymbomonas tetramitiformis]|uniref:Uncharacterized protein n=1 Tax=Cymbomonas tetramitiformis TaxID=36881 RepID=A0AAE0FDE8_9CHLO|nr:hypothetical protein CYMTET_33571 [Cymbomonas tetramitiformis]
MVDVTGLGGFVTFPVAVPTALAAAYCVRFRLCLAMAYGGGYDLHAPATITAVLMCTYGGQPMQATHPEIPAMEMIQNPPEEEEEVGMLDRIRQMAETGITDASGQQETELDKETTNFDEKAKADIKAEEKEDDLEQIVAAGWTKSGPRRRALLTAHKAYTWWVEAQGGGEASSQEDNAALAQQAYLLALYREITLCVPMSVRSALNSTAYLAEVIPLVGGVVSGGTDGVLTTAAGRKAKACFLKCAPGPGPHSDDRPIPSRPCPSPAVGLAAGAALGSVRIIDLTMATASSRCS